MAEYVTDFNWGAVDAEGNPDYRTRERVVRCRDCVFTEEEGRFCNFFTDESGEISIPASVEPDGFCAWGKECAGERVIDAPKDCPLDQDARMWSTLDGMERCHGDVVECAVCAACPLFIDHAMRRREEVWAYLQERRRAS